MKKIKIIILLFLFINCVSSFAAPIKSIVFFGDSLSDNGNLYRYLWIIPQSPPYYNGRFSNGPTWAENLGQYYHDKYKISYENYAVGGATTVLRNPFKGILPFEVKEEIYDYLVRSNRTERGNTLFAIWIGANDYMSEGSEDADTLTSEVVNEISTNISTLISYGAKNFLILNIPDLSKTPRATASDSNMKLRLSQLSLLHNQKLAEIIKNIQNQYPHTGFITIDIYSFFNDLLSNPEKYSQKYNVHITNITESCWTGGYTTNSSKRQTLIDINAATLNTELQQVFAKKRELQSLNTQALATYILKSPELEEAYTIGKMQEAGATPCSKPDEYVFWDAIHPTQTTHEIIAKGIEEQLQALVQGYTSPY